MALNAQDRKKGKGLLLLSSSLIIIGVVLALVVGMGALKNSTANASGVPSETSVGNDNNVNPVLGEVQSWTQLKNAVEGKEEWYKQCLESRNGITWSDVSTYSYLETGGADLRVILVSNSNVSDQQARVALAQKGFKDVAGLTVIRVNGFENTYGLPTNGCSPGWDNRSQIRLALGVPVDVNNLGKGFDQHRGVLAGCTNPWGKKGGGSPSPAPGPAPKPKPGCPPPKYVPPSKWLPYPDCRKKDQTFDQMQGPGSGVFQSPQNNKTSGSYTGPTKDGNGKPIPEPSKRPKGPSGSAAPPTSNTGGYDSGSPSGAPGGSTSDGSGSTTGDRPGTGNPQDPNQGGSGNNTDPGPPA